MNKAKPNQKSNLETVFSWMNDLSEYRFCYSNHLCRLDRCYHLYGSIFVKNFKSLKNSIKLCALSWTMGFVLVQDISCSLGSSLHSQVPGSVAPGSRALAIHKPVAAGTDTLMHRAAVTRGHLLHKMSCEKWLAPMVHWGGSDYNIQIIISNKLS